MAEEMNAREETNVPAASTPQQQPPLDHPGAMAPRIPGHQIGSEAWERDQLVDRLRSLRRVLPVLAQEMATARRQAARLKVENRHLSEQVRELRAARAALEARVRKAA